MQVESRMSESSPASEAAAVAQLVYPHLHALKSDKSDIDSYHYHSQHYHSFKLLTINANTTDLSLFSSD